MVHHLDSQDVLGHNANERTGLRGTWSLLPVGGGALLTGTRVTSFLPLQIHHGIEDPDKLTHTTGNISFPRAVCVVGKNLRVLSTIAAFAVEVWVILILRMALEKQASKSSS